MAEVRSVPDLWNHPERVILRLKELGCKKFRFSVSRDKVEPQLGSFDKDALEHYRTLCRLLKEADVEPIVTLHHFSDPTYFSWERSEDIAGFVRYAEQISEVLYAEGVRKIITLNEPTVLVFQGWIQGEFPPHHTRDFEGAGCVLEHMMCAHSQVYKALKCRHADFEIGLTHDPIRFRHFHKMHPLWTPLEKILCHYLTELNHSALMRYLQTGKFSFSIPFLARCTFKHEKPPLDFIGLQYYSDPLLKLSFKGVTSVTREPNEKLTSLQYRVYPQGLASALDEMSTLGVPIDLTEIGIDTAITTDESDWERIRYFDRIFQVVQKAVDYGIPVRSLYFWTLIDNLEWNRAWSARFGFYKFDPDSGEITPRPVSQWLRARITAANELSP
jgi:beta-glucosidase